MAPMQVRGDGTCFTLEVQPGQSLYFNFKEAAAKVESIISDTEVRLASPGVCQYEKGALYNYKVIPKLSYRETF